jgi:RimJ/RimL family protein N-acetyltransferase
MSILTVFSLSDFSQLFLIQSDLELAKLRQASGIAKEISDVEAWFKRRTEKQSPHDFILAIRDKTDGVLIGYVTLVDHSKKREVAELGIVIGNRKGVGFGTEALLALEKLAAENFGFWQFEVKVLTKNTRAQSFFEKNGYGISSYSNGVSSMIKAFKLN